MGDIATLRLLTPEYRHGVALQTERNASVDRGTTFGLGVDGDAALHEFQPLLHVGETKPSPRVCRFEIKAHTAITDCEMNFIRRSIQLHIELPHSAMLCRVVQGSLQHAEEAKGNVRRYEVG